MNWEQKEAALRGDLEVRMSQKLKMAEDSRAWKQGVAGVCPSPRIT